MRRYGRVRRPAAPPGTARVLAAVALAGGVATVAGCTEEAGDNGNSGDPTTTPTARAYRPPADPCEVVPPDLAKRLGMRDARPDSVSQFAANPADPKDRVVVYRLIECEWTVNNPGRGLGGRPNQMTVWIKYAVIGPERSNAAAIAGSVYADKNKKSREDKDIKAVREGRLSVSADEGYYRYVIERSTTGTESVVQASVRLANAVVTVEYSGADLKLDRTLPAGLQLVTTLVPESRLGPAVETLLPVAIEGVQS